MSPLAKVALVLAGVGTVALVVGGDESPRGATDELVTGTYGTKSWSIRRHGAQGFAYAVDGAEVSAAATLRDAFEDVLGYLGEHGEREDVVRFQLVDRARSVVVQHGMQGWDWTVYRGTLIDGEGRGLTRGAALLAALEHLENIIDEM